ncbi:glycosyltransferase [Streptomyces sp. NPDC087270]|uniref:glycosyltransferase n=1 Tax=Streptomyces sp. NPDC087270 TaxID=3365774 RepID=UPI003817AF2D
MKVLLCPLSSGGFLHPATAAALELHRRGHDVTLFAAGAAGRAAAAAGIAVLPAATEREPYAFDVSRWFRDGESQYRVVRDAARALRPDVVVTSVLCPGALLAAEVLDLPVVVLGLTCHLWPYAGPAVGGDTAGPDPDPDTDSDGGFDADSDAEDRRWRLAETLKHHQALRDRLGLRTPQPADPARQLLGRAFLLRGHPGLELPGAVLPRGVRHVGPLWWEPSPDDDPPSAGASPHPDDDTLAEHLDRVGKPLVYVHLGRTFGGESLWRWIDAAFTGTGHQAVVELARTSTRAPAPGSDVVTVRRPRMGDLLARAEAVVSNGTSAPVLGALLHARPLLLRPNGGEQRLLGAACLRAGVAAELPVHPAPGDAVSRAVGDARLRTAARTLGTALAQAKSATAAAQEIEEAAR